jgi:hypothetical protein
VQGVRIAVVESHNGGLGNTAAIAHCMAEANKAGMQASIYSFWCPNCGGNTPAHDKMAEHVHWLKSQNIKFDRIWLDIETCDGTGPHTCPLPLLLSTSSVSFLTHLLCGVVCTCVSRAGCWGSHEENAQFISDLISGAKSAGAEVGIYTNENEWVAVVNGVKDFPDLPLWYAHYDGRPSFDDWRPFAGWEKPHMKQYNDHSEFGCYDGVDSDWM